MKKIFQAILLAGCFAPRLASAAIVTGNTVDAISDPNISFMLFKARAAGPQSGTNGLPGGTVRVSVDGNNNFSATLPGGYYDAYFGSDSAMKVLAIFVPPNDTNTYTLNQVAQLAADETRADTGKPAAQNPAQTPAANAAPPASPPGAAGNLDNFDTAGAIWQAMPVAPVCVGYSPMYNGVTTNADYILVDLTNIRASGRAALLQRNHTPLEVGLDVCTLIRNPDGSLGFNTNFFRHGITNYVNAVHALGWKARIAFYVNGDLNNPGPAGCYFTTASGPAIYYTNMTQVADPNAFFDQPTNYYNPIVTAADLRNDLATIYRWGFDGVQENDMSVSSASYRIMEESSAYYSLYPYVASSSVQMPWNYVFPYRAHPLWIIPYESMFVNVTNGFDIVPGPDTSRWRNGMLTDAFPITGIFGTNGPFSVKELRYMKTMYPLLETTSHGGYLPVGGTLCQAVADVAAIASFPVGPWLPGNIASLDYFTNANWAAIHDDPLQNFPALVDFGINTGSAWVKKKSDGNQAVAFFNESAAPRTFSITWPQAGIPDGTAIAVSDLRGNLLGVFNHAFSTNLDYNGSCLLNFNQTNVFLMLTPTNGGFYWK
jgi:hypothetical protein